MSAIVTERVFTRIMGIDACSTTVNALWMSVMFVRKMRSMCRTSIVSEMSRAYDQEGFLSPNMNLRHRHPNTPERAVETEQAIAV